MGRYCQTHLFLHLSNSFVSAGCSETLDYITLTILPAYHPYQRYYTGSRLSKDGRDGKDHVRSFRYDSTDSLVNQIMLSHPSSQRAEVAIKLDKLYRKIARHRYETYTQFNSDTARKAVT